MQLGAQLKGRIEHLVQLEYDISRTNAHWISSLNFLGTSLQDGTSTNASSITVLC